MKAMEWLLGLVSRDQNEYVVIVQLLKNLYDFGFMRAHTTYFLIPLLLQY